MEDREQRRRLAKAVLVAGLLGAAIVGLLHYVALPAVVRGLTSAQVRWLREAFELHTGWFLLAVVVLAAVLSLPVLLVALWTARAGPWRE